MRRDGEKLRLERFGRSEIWKGCVSWTDAGAESCGQWGIMGGAVLHTLALNICVWNYF